MSWFSGWFNESKRHSLASQGIKTGSVPKQYNLFSFSEPIIKAQKVSDPLLDFVIDKIGNACNDKIEELDSKITKAQDREKIDELGSDLISYEEVIVELEKVKSIEDLKSKEVFQRTGFDRLVASYIRDFKEERRHQGF